MKYELEEKVSYGNNVIVVKKDEDCTVYKMEDDTGSGTMTCYSVFPGIDLLYNDFHMEGCISEFLPKVDMLAIDHCREGRIEWELQNASYMYLQEGDMQVGGKGNHKRGFSFPLSHYHGITVALYIEEASKTISSILGGFSVDLKDLHNKFCLGKNQFIMRGEDSIQHIFSELYTVPKKIRKNYFQIKVLELLLFLSVIDVPVNGEERKYFPKNQVEKIKLIKKYITKNMGKHYTLDELSLMFDISLTTMKTCFKGVYGLSIYAYIRSYRMHAASLMIRKTSESISSIAGKVGYDNSSKFSAAFKAVIGVTPQEHRKSFV